MDALNKHKGNDNISIGLNGNLIDKEGFPRADIDIHAIRLLRNEYARLQNDHKSVMLDIEKSLKKFMSLPNKASHNSPKLRSSLISEKFKDQQNLQDNGPESIPFFRVDAVEGGSPAEISGLRVGDLISKFSHITADTIGEDSLATIVEIISKNVSKEITIVVERNLSHLTLEIVPQPWEGQGFLGCKLVPL